MKRLVCLALGISFAFFSRAQPLKKVAIGKSGCSIYTYCPVTVDTEYSQDSSLVYIADCEKDGVVYGMICVKLKLPAGDISKAEQLLTDYLDYLKSNFNIIKSAGYGKGHHLAGNENTRGVIDYWEDNEKNNWKVKGWTDGKFIAVLYGHSLKELPEQKLNVFLDGFRFPGM